MKRVLEVFCSLEKSGGVQAVVMNIFRAIDRDKVVMDFAVYQNPEENSYYDEIISCGSEVVMLDNPSSCGLLRFYQECCELFARKHYDAVHAHNIHHNGLILLAAKRAGIPIRISHSHQAYDERNVSLPRRVMVKALCALNNRVATRRIACSDLAGKFLYGNRAFEFLPNAIDMERFNVIESKTELREKYNLDKTKKIVIHVGHFYTPKNQFFLIEIMKCLRSNNCLLLMAGDGPLYESFKQRIREEGLEESILCLGQRSDVAELLKLSDCMLLPSIYEGLPVVAVEAQAVGCHCLLSDVVTRQADLGLGLVNYLPIDDPTPWAETIINYDMREDCPDKEMIKQRMEELRFDAQINLDSWYELYGVKER